MTIGAPNSKIDRESEISALGKALAIERKARYTDFRGKRSTFSEFMRKTAERLMKRFPMDLRWTTIRGLYRNYSSLDIAARISVIRRTDELLFGRHAVIDEPAQSPAQKNSVLPSITKADVIASLHSALEVREPSVSSGSTGGARIGMSPNMLASSPYATKNAKAASPNGGQVSKAQKNETSSGKGRTTELVPKKLPEKKSQFGKEAKDEQGATPKEIQQNARRNDKDPREYDVQFIRGVGPRMAELLGRLGIKTADDLLRHYPRQHLDFQNHVKIRELEPGEDVTILGTIKSVGAFQSKKGNISILAISINDGSGTIGISKFVGGKSNKYLLDRYKASYPKGAQVIASGRVERDGYSGRLQLKNAEIEILGALAASDDEMESLHTGRLVPVYPLTEGLSLRFLRGIIHNALDLFAAHIKDPLSASLRERLGLSDLLSSLWGIHFPEDLEQKEESRKRLVFDELLLAQLHLAIRRYRFQNSNEALALPLTNGELLNKFKQELPFKLTGAQERVFNEIAKDLASPKPMHRLVQGDVGSGKTVVAAMAGLVAIENGFQVAVMAPTEILAEQHYRQFQKWLSPLGIRCALLLGKQGVKERRAIQQDLSNGQIHVAIGTHALIQDDVEFKKLGFVIIDEQHRFGVKQRARLKAKGTNPELLTMTATPIPRTLALSMHGDLDVSEIDELPPGRKPIDTKVLTPGKRKELYTAIKEQIAFGRQVYIVFPLIEESETLSAKAATVEYERLRESIFPEISIGLMHGKLKSQEKDEVMEKFRAAEYKILVSTTVIEVGVDVPNATVMVIENADRFGLSQLHQLRGRVGRGGEKSYCYLVAEAKSETTRQRLGIMEQTNDGFVVAEKDLELRGPGEFLGVRQSGMPDLVLADIVLDAKILEEARKIAIEIVKEDPELSQYPLLKESIELKRGAETSELLTSG